MTLSLGQSSLNPDRPSRTNFAAAPAIAPDPRDPNDPGEVTRRVHMLLESMPSLRDEEESLYNLAASNLDDVTMVENAAMALSSTGWAKEAERLRALSEPVQRGLWANANSLSQRALVDQGYEPPGEDDDGQSWLGRALEVGTTPVVGALNIAKGSYEKIGAPLLHGLDVVSDQPAHLFRMGVEMNQDQSGPQYLRGLEMFTPFGWANAALHPKAAMDAFYETGNGERYFTDPAREAAREELANVSVEDADADELLNIAEALSGGTSPEEYLADLADPDSPEYQQNAVRLTTLMADPAFQKAKQGLDNSKISVGRDFTRMFGIDDTSYVGDWVSGLGDAAFVVGMDPTLAAGKLTKSIRLARIGVKVANGTSNMEKLYETRTSVRAAMDEFATRAQSGEWYDFVQRYPHMANMVPFIRDEAPNLQTGADAARFFRDGQALDALMAGHSASWRSTGVLAPKINTLDRWKSELRHVAGAVIDRNTDNVVYARAARKAGESQTIRGRLRSIPVGEKGRTVNLDPFAQASQLLKGIGTAVPRKGVVSMAGAESAVELKKLVEMGLMADMPSSVRKKWFDDIIAGEAGNIGARHATTKSFINDMFSYLPEDDGFTQFRDRFQKNLDQMYSTASGKDHIPGMQGKHALYPDADASIELATPDPNEFVAAGRQLSVIRAALGMSVNSAWVDRGMTSVWKPSVLLRIGFIPRAAGEELLNWMVRAPMAYPRYAVFASAAADTEDSIARRIGVALKSPQLRGVDLEREWKALGSAATLREKRFPNFVAFQAWVAENADRSPMLASLAQNKHTAFELKRYYDLKVRGNSTLLRPFQMLAGITGQIARPWRDEVENTTDILYETGRFASRDLAKTEATKRIDNIRTHWAVTDPLFRMAHNIAATAPGGLDAGLDQVARSAMFHASQGYRAMLRNVLNPQQIDLMRAQLTDPTVMRAFQQHASAGMAGITGSPNETITLDITMADGTISRQHVRAKGSTYKTRDLRGSDTGEFDHLAAHALHNRHGHIMGDRLTRAADDVTVGYITPRMQNEILGLSVPDEGLARESIEEVLDGFDTAIAQMPPEENELFLVALRSGEPDDMDDLLTAAAKLQDPAALALAEEFARMSPRSKSAIADHIDYRSTHHGEKPALSFNHDEWRARAIDTVHDKLQSAEMQTAKARMSRANVASISGDPVGAPVREGHTRLLVPMMDSDKSFRSAKQIATDIPELTGYGRIGVGAAEKRRSVLADKDIVDGLFRQMERPFQPIGGFATEKLDDAIRISAKARGGDAVVGYIDVPTTSLGPVGDETGRVWRLHNDNPEIVGQHFIVEPTLLTRTQTQPLHLAPTTGPDGTVIFGKTQYEADREWAEQIVDDYADNFMNRDRTEMLHELRARARADADDPIFNLAGERAYRYNTGHVLRVGDDLPESTFSPDYEQKPQNLWTRFLKFGFDDVIGNSINTIIRKPMFMHNYLNASNEILAAGLGDSLLDPALWGETQRRLRKRTRITVLDHIEEAGKISPAVRNEMYNDRHIMGSVLLGQPGDDLTLAMQQRFPDFPGTFTVPETNFDIAMQDFPEATQYGPRLNPWTEQNYHAITDELEMLGTSAPTAKLQHQANLINDVLNDAKLVSPDGSSNPLILGRRQIDMPRVRRVDHTEVEEEVITTGALSTLADETAPMRFNALMQKQIPPEYVETFMTVSKELYGDALPNEVMTILARNEDEVPKFQAALRRLWKSDKSHKAAAKYLRDSIGETVERARTIHTPQTMIAQFGEIDWKARTHFGFRGVPMKPEVYADWEATVPEWLRAVGKDNMAILKEGELQAARAVEHVRDIAIQRAINDTLPFIDNHNIRSQYQVWARNITPFWFAEEQFLRRWAKTLTYTPESIRRAQLLYQGFREGGVIQTDDTGRDVLVYPGSAALTQVLQQTVGKVPLGKQIFGADARLPIASLMTGEVKYATPGFDGLGIPGVAPAVALPLSELVHHFPELAPLEAAVVGERNVGRGAVRTFVPASLMRVYDAVANEENIAAAVNTTVQFMAVNGQLPAEDAGETEREEWLRRVESQTRVNLLVKALVGFVVPSTPRENLVDSNAMSIRANLGLNLKGSNLSPELGRLINQMGIEEGTAAFLELHPDATPHDAFNDNRYWLGSENERPSRAPLPATREAADFFDTNQAWLKKFPGAGGWFLPQASKKDKFDRRAYHQQVANEMRIRKAPKQFLDDLYYSAGADTYFESKTNFDAQMAEAAGDTPEAVARRTELEGSWRAWKTGYFAQHPVMARELSSGEGREARQRVLDEMEVAMADPERPVVNHAPLIHSVMVSFKNYQAQIDQLYGDRRKAASTRRAEIKEGFGLWLQQFMSDHPEVQAFVRAIIIPSTDIGPIDAV